MDLSYFHLQILTLLLLIALIFTSINRRKTSKTTGIPPGPWTLPLIGSLHHLIGTHLHRILRDLATKHGPIFHLQLGQVSAIVVSSPLLAKEILKTQDLAFPSRPQLEAVNIVVYNSTNLLFSPYCDYWKQIRKICVSELLNPKNVQSFGSIRQQEGSRMVESIRDHAGQTIDLSRQIMSYTSSMVCRAAFGRERAEQEMFLALMHEVSRYALGFLIGDLFPSCKFLDVVIGTRRKLESIHKKIDKFFDEIIDEHVQNLSRGEGKQDEDLIDVLLRVKERQGSEFSITYDNIKAIIFDMFAAGSDTSTSTVNWAMSELIRNPTIMAKAQEEIRQAFGTKRKVDESRLHELKYLKMVIKETLRLHPPGAVLMRQACQENIEVNGYHIPNGTSVFVNAWAIGRDPEHWVDPESFKPERFLDKDIEFTGSDPKYMPFGMGRRMCPGVSFGMANVELPLALLLYHFDWQLPHGVESNDLDMTETSELAVTKKKPLCLVARNFTTE